MMCYRAFGSQRLCCLCSVFLARYSDTELAARRVQTAQGMCLLDQSN